MTHQTNVRVDLFYYNTACFCLFSANYLGSWKSISVMKGDGTPEESGRNPAGPMAQAQSMMMSNGNGDTARYIRAAPVASANQVVWH